MEIAEAFDQKDPQKKLRQMESLMWEFLRTGAVIDALIEMCETGNVPTPEDLVPGPHRMLAMRSLVKV